MDVFNLIDQCAMPSCKIKGCMTCVHCFQTYCDWHGRDYLKQSTIGDLCGDCVFQLAHELKGLMY